MGGRASSEDRTRDLALTKRMLCQLSYRGLVQLGGHGASQRRSPRCQTASAPPLQCVHSTRVVFNPSKVKIRVRVPMNASRLHSLGAGPLLVAQVAWVRIPVKAFSFLFPFSHGRATPRLARHSSYGHIKVRAAHPIRTANLSTFELNQYYSGGPCGNLECCTAHSFLCFLFLFCFAFDGPRHVWQGTRRTVISR